MSRTGADNKDEVGLRCRLIFFLIINYGGEGVCAKNMRLRIFRSALSALVLLLLAQVLAAEQEIPEAGAVEEHLLRSHFDGLENTAPALEVDTNGNGQIDYLVKTHKKSNDKIMEVLDYNHDGRMDDYYFYQEGVLKERAIDSNYDGRIDLWVFIGDGIYIQGYQRDSNFDGQMDEVESYEREEE